MKKEHISKELVDINNKLHSILITLKLLNSDGKQCDYVTDPALSNLVDQVTDKVNKINKIMYQKS